MEKDVKTSPKDDFNKQTACKAPFFWSKYTTGGEWTACGRRNTRRSILKIILTSFALSVTDWFLGPDDVLGWKN